MVVNIVDVGWATSKSGCLPITAPRIPSNLSLFPALHPIYAWLSLYHLSLFLLSVFPLFFQPSHLHLHCLLKVFPVSKFSSYLLPIPHLSPSSHPSVSPLPPFYLTLFLLLPIPSLRLPLLPPPSLLCFPVSSLSLICLSLYISSVIFLRPSVSQSPRASNVCPCNLAGRCLVSLNAEKVS